MASSSAGGWPRGASRDVIRYLPQVMTPFLTELAVTERTVAAINAERQSR
jgi:hypothetical protein